jgi:hypothetical protein
MCADRRHRKGKNVAASYHLILASQMIHTGSLRLACSPSHVD